MRTIVQVILGQCEALITTLWDGTRNTLCYGLHHNSLIVCLLAVGPLHNRVDWMLELYRRPLLYQIY